MPRLQRPGLSRPSPGMIPWVMAKHGRCYGRFWYRSMASMATDPQIEIQETLPWSCCRRHRDSSAASPGSPPRWPRARLWGPVTRCWWRSLLEKLLEKLGKKNGQTPGQSHQDDLRPSLKDHLLEMIRPRLIKQQSCYICYFLTYKKKQRGALEVHCFCFWFKMLIPPALNIEKDVEHHAQKRTVLFWAGETTPDLCYIHVASQKFPWIPMENAMEISFFHSSSKVHNNSWPVESGNAIGAIQIFAEAIMHSQPAIEKSRFYWEMIGRWLWYMKLCSVFVGIIRGILSYNGILYGLSSRMWLMEYDDWDIIHERTFGVIKHVWENHVGQPEDFPRALWSCDQLRINVASATMLHMVLILFGI